MKFKSLSFATAFCLAGLAVFAGDGGKGKKPADAAGQLKLPAGFKAETVIENFGRTRHLAVTPNGVIFVKLEKLKDGKGIYRLEDTNGDGKPDKITGFGDYVGTGMAVRDGYLYASSNTDVYRYKLDGSNNVVNPDKPEKIVSGLLDRHQHNSKSIALDNSGNIYVNIGAYANSCQVQDRTKGSPGRMPCPILDSAGGIWQFKADRPDQTYGTGVHYASGLRNVVGLDWNTQTNSLFVMQHGRDQLSDNWPQYFNTKQSAELPSECMYELHKGSNCGWPYIYYDQIQHKQVLAPEYGGDGKKGPEKEFQDPVVAFPGHLAPDGLLFYTGNQFPEKYKNGAFVAFHGSWNRAPEPQAGFFVVFVPFKDGKPSGNWEVFADNFSGGADKTASGRVDYRPCGLAQGPDGALYVTDDTKGVIWKISYNK
ncbi:MAG TPA: PQQ-dependent sugar dehydrogenase [Puia sp.]|uniref:PQQ-dependent sugar dehydrogenase n=1 Tax=Puia sp. TaxID=2045100 RepID=UPI002B94CAD2|nr:PQQ-dependent sugar dehydrogenase [Puia sp.]HVU95865.1 PQQ-dependent sugar dehydrogenase [Puia sp.]